MYSLSLVSIGPGALEQMTPAAQTAIATADVVIGYQVYLEQLEPLLQAEQEVITSQLGSEMARAEQAVEMAKSGRSVAMVSSGDIGIYAMASPVFDVLRTRGWTGEQPEVMVYPGISAIQATAARLGAPLGHDFCTISLSDLLTPWSVIERRVRAAAWGDFVIGFYNPRSKKRDWQLARAIEILRSEREPDTPVAIARNVTRPDESITITTLGEFDPTMVDMFTLVLVGNSQTYRFGSWVATPRGYGHGGSSEPVNPQHTDRVGQDSPHDQQTELFADWHQERPSIYPIALTGLRGANVLVVGGGPVGERKVKNLLAVGAQIKLVSPQATPHLQEWAKSNQIQWQQRPYQTGDTANVKLVFAATDQRAVNAQVGRDAARLGVLYNIADAPFEGEFHLPAVYRQDGVTVAVSTEQARPRQATNMRNTIAELLEQKAK